MRPSIILFTSMAMSSSSTASAFTLLGRRPTIITQGYYPQSPQYQQSRLFMNMFSDLFAAPEVATAQELKKAYAHPNIVVIDVRSPGEITTKVDVSGKGALWFNAPGTPLANPDLAPGGAVASQLPKNKATPIIVYCASGKRSQKAASILREQGYENVLNAGGIGQISGLPVVKA